MAADQVNPGSDREPIRFLVFAASLRAASLNAKLVRLAAEKIEEHGGTVDFAFMTEFDVPPMIKMYRIATAFRRARRLFTTG